MNISSVYREKIRFLEFHLNDSLQQDYPHLSTPDPCEIKYGRPEQGHRELLKRAEIWTQIWTNIVRRILVLSGDKAKLAIMSQIDLALACFEEDKSKMYHCKFSHARKYGWDHGPEKSNIRLLYLDLSIEWCNIILCNWYEKGKFIFGEIIRKGIRSENGNILIPL